MLHRHPQWWSRWWRACNDNDAINGSIGGVGRGSANRRSGGSSDSGAMFHHACHVQNDVHTRAGADVDDGTLPTIGFETALSTVYGDHPMSAEVRRYREGWG